eukprot:7993-Heterococcus_DN1.PRE.2
MLMQQVVVPRAPKRSVIDNRPPLHEIGVLQRKKGYMDSAKQFTCTPKMTMYSAVFASPSRVRLAHESGLQCATPAYQYAAGKHGTVASLWAAHELGMEYSVAVMLGAAECNQRPDRVMQFLHAQNCPWDTTVPVAALQRGARQLGVALSEYTMAAAAANGRTAMCAYLRSKQCPWNAHASASAARGGHLDTCAGCFSMAVPELLVLTAEQQQKAAV